MEELLRLLQDGRSRSVEALASELSTTPQDVLRRMDFLEHAGIIRRVGHERTNGSECAGCGSSCKKHSECASCLPKGGFSHMGELWEVVG